MNKIILYIATSLDGFIADIHGRVDWLPQPKDETELEAIGYNALMSRIETILMGSQSYKQILGFGDWAWANKQTYVFTSQTLQSEKSYIHITSDHPLEFMSKFKNHQTEKDIWLLGGAKLAHSFAKDNLIDEIILTIVPKTLGEGISLGLTFEEFDLDSEKTLINGMLQKIYLKKKT